MQVFEIFFIALALAMDAFAVSVSAGAYFGKATVHQKFRLSFHFGLFQFFMPIIGWLVGAKVEHYIGDYDHWVAFVILAAVGGKMLFEAITNNEPLVNKDISRGWSLVSLALATSIDANAVGISFGIIDHAIIIPAIVIGVVASAMSLIGIKFGEKLSEFFGRKVEIVGGIILILIGVEIVIEHLTA